MSPKTIVLLSLCATSFVWGALQLIVPPDVTKPLQIATFLSTALLIFLWYRMDSDSMHYHRSPLLNVAVVGFAALAIPYYLFRTRGLRGGFKALAACLAMFVAIVLSTVLGSVAAISLGWA